MKGFVGFLLICVLLSACEGPELPSYADANEYFPLQKGVYQIYQVRSKQYYSSTIIEQSDYELKTEVTDSFPSANGNYTYVIHRSSRSTSNDEWQPLDTWSVRKAGSEVIVAEGNTPYVKMKSPYTTANSWDGNAYNTLGKDEYMFGEVGTPKDIEGITFEKTLLVEQERNDDSIVFRDERQEIYAVDVGLIYKKLTRLRYCTDDACLGQQKVDDGVEMTMVIREYGKM